MLQNDLRPIIQTHTFDVEPYLPFMQGYAPFLISSSFDGSEEITFETFESMLENPVLIHRLSEYRSGKWYLTESERIKAACGGILKPGNYQFAIRRPNKPVQNIFIKHDPYFIEPSREIKFQAFKAEFEIEWSASKEADNFWIFLLPHESRNFLNDLIPVTERQYKETRVILDPQNFPRGGYRIVVRTNRMWDHPSISGFLSEAWSISETNIILP